MSRNFKRTRLSAWAISDPGSRDHNEDAFLIFQSARQSVIAVCDGMGGHAAGEVASGLAVKTIQEFFTEMEKSGGLELEASDAVKASIDKANATIHGDAKANPARDGMGSTCVVGLMRNNKLHLGHVGDSRAYMVRGGGIRQLTRDHSFVEEMVKAGMITPHETHSNPQRNVILQSLGRNESVNVELCSEAVTLKVGDYILLCSDGLTAVVADQEIADAVVNLGDPQTICEHLVELTNQRGAPDNVTVAMVRFDGMVNEGPRVALFCDDEENLDLYRLVLNREGYQVSSPRAADLADMAHADRPRLIIADHRNEPEKSLRLCREFTALNYAVMLVNHGEISEQLGAGVGAKHVQPAETLLTDLTSVVRHLTEENSSIVYILEETDGQTAKLARSLRREGLIVFTYASQQALEHAVLSRAPNMLILNVVRGVERLCQIFKMHPSTAECPIVISAQGAVANPREAFQLGADYYLTRADDITKLAHMLLNK